MATQIVFGASGKEGKLQTAVADGEPQTVAGALNSRVGLVQLQDRDGKPFWVNAVNVLYVREAPESSEPLVGRIGHGAGAAGKFVGQDCGQDLLPTPALRCP